MHDLTLIDSALPGALTVAEIDATMGYAAAEKAAATRKAYDSDWANFTAWCAARGATPLPAHVGIVAAYLSWLAESGRKASTIGRRAAAIGHRHKLAGHEPPTSQEGVRAMLRGIRRTIGAARAGKAPATADILTAMLRLCPPTLAGSRDRALLALGFAGAFRRSELVALEVADPTEAPDGLRVRIRRSKTDQEGEGSEIAIPRGYRLRPVEAVQAWLAAAGPLFRPVLKGGRIQPEPLSLTIYEGVRYGFKLLATTVPEPAALTVFGTGLIVLGLFSRHRRHALVIPQGTTSMSTGWVNLGRARRDKVVRTG
jgi:integrase